MRWVLPGILVTIWAVVLVMFLLMLSGWLSGPGVGDLLEWPGDDERKGRR